MLGLVFMESILLYGRIRKKGFPRTDWIYSDLRRVIFFFYRYMDKETLLMCKPPTLKCVSRTSSKTWLASLPLQGNGQDEESGDPLGKSR